MKPLLSFHNVREEPDLPADVVEAFAAGSVAAAEGDQFAALRHLTRAVLIAANQDVDAARLITRVVFLLQMLPGGREEFAEHARPAARALFAGVYRPHLSRCSFCAKDEDSIERLIVAATVRICNECVERCVTLLRREGLTISEGAAEHVRPADADKDPRR